MTLIYFTSETCSLILEYKKACYVTFYYRHYTVSEALFSQDSTLNILKRSVQLFAIESKCCPV